MKYGVQTFIILLVGAGILGATYVFDAPRWMQTFFILFPMLAAGIELGKDLLPFERPVLKSIWGFIATIALLVLIRGIWFYLDWNLSGWGEVLPEITVFIGLGVYFGIRSFAKRNQTSEVAISSRGPFSVSEFIFPVIALSFSIAAFCLIAFVAHRAGTEQSIRTPWPLLPAWTLPLIATQWIFAIATLWKLQNRWIGAIQTATALASSTVIASLVYRVGYGFDGFLHVAGESILLKTGTLQPHPMYYMGQYLFTTWISRIADLQISAVDRWLVPTISALLLPLSLLACTDRNHRVMRFAALAFIPIVPFVTTTPHGFSIVLACAAVLLGIGVSEKTVHPSLPILIAMWCTLTHPLVGLPILGATIALAIYGHARHLFRTPLSIVAAIGGSLAVPLLFGLASAIGSSAGVNFHLENLFSAEKWKELSSAWIPWVQNRYAIWAEASVWIEKLLPWIIIGLALTERVIHLIKKQPTPPWLSAAFATVASAVILTLAGDFGFLIDYERGNYAERLWLVGLLLLLPLAIPAFGRLLHRIGQGHRLSLAGVLAGIGILAAGITYASLPRHDAVTPSRGWSVGLADIEAVKLIDEDSNQESYTVLANQSVSAAAVRTFGFKRYHNDVFFYPIPTGGSLYETFLKASYGDPSIQTMAEAGELGDSHLIYFVVNDYWWKSDELSELAKKDASRVFEIQNGKVKIFKYDLNKQN